MRPGPNLGFPGRAEKPQPGPQSPSRAGPGRPTLVNTGKLRTCRFRKCLEAACQISNFLIHRKPSEFGWNFEGPNLLVIMFASGRNGGTTNFQRRNTQFWHTTGKIRNGVPIILLQGISRIRNSFAVVV